MTSETVRWLRRKEAAAFCTARGCTTASATLAKLAVVGGGPEFRRWGRIPLYEPDALDRWIEGRLSPVLTSTSDAPRAEPRPQLQVTLAAAGAEGTAHLPQPAMKRRPGRPRKIQVA